MSMPSRSAVGGVLDARPRPAHGSVVPAERAEAKKPDLAPSGKSRSVEQLAHHAPTCAGGADDRDGQAAIDRRSSAGPAVDHGLALARRRGRTRCAPRARRRRRRRRRQTTEIRISEVEIISMLTPASASAAKNVAVTPGCERMPAPTSETLPIWSSYSSDSKPISSCGPRRAPPSPSGPSALGQGEGDVGEAGRRRGDVLHDHVDVDLGVGDAPRRCVAALPGLSGTPTTVIFASLGRARLRR